MIKTNHFASRRTPVTTLLAGLLGILAYHFTVTASAANGFDISNSIIPANEILHGGPPRDGIPAISQPKMVNAADADFLQDSDRVIGIEIDGEARAYSIGILNWHEIVNDQIGDKAVAITYCPLCGTGVAFDATVDGEVTEFGVSGLLYNSDVLLYDRNSESLWSQIKRQAIAGEKVGQKLTSLPIQHTTWGYWREQFPDTLVLSEDTGYARDYRRNPYAGYETSRATYFAVNHKAPDTYHPKEEVLGIEVDGAFKAYPFVELDKLGKSSFEDDFNGKQYRVHWNGDSRSARVSATSSTAAPDSIQGFWFAWFAFHPETQVFSAEDFGN